MVASVAPRASTKLEGAGTEQLGLDSGSLSRNDFFLYKIYSEASERLYLNFTFQLVQCRAALAQALL